VLYFIGVISLIVNVFFLEIKFLYIYSLGFIFSFGLFAMVYDKNKDAGLLIIDEFGLKIRESAAIPINEISDLKITIIGFEGKMTGFLKGMDSGNNNKIEFTHSNEKYEYRFFLSYQKMEMLDYISDKWKINSPQIFRKEKSFLKDFILRRLDSKK
jgi:hypothetical protein